MSQAVLDTCVPFWRSLWFQTAAYGLSSMTTMETEPPNRNG